MLYEVVYGYVVKYFGDDMVYVMGCIGINLLWYIDLIGMIVMLLLLYFVIKGVFVFGYVKLVFVCFGCLCDLCWYGMWVVLVGLVINFVQVIFWGVLVVVFVVGGVNDLFLIGMVCVGILVNMVMVVFNMFLLLLFDGGCVLVVFLLFWLVFGFLCIELFGFFIVMVLIIFNVIINVWMCLIMVLLF